MPNFSTANMLGANLAQTFAPISATTPDVPGLPFALGQQAEASDGSLFVFVKATTALSQYDCVYFDENYEAKPLTQAISQTGAQRVGLAQVAFTINYYGWIMVRGAGGRVTVGASCAADVALYATSTAGTMDDSVSDTSVASVLGLWIVDANTDTSVSTNKEAILNWPRINVAPG